MTMQASQFDSTPQARSGITVSVEVLAYAAIFCGALALRTIGLGAAPLNPLEARQAVSAARWLSPDVTGSAAIDSLLVFVGAAISFTLATPTAAAARFFPMLGGLALTLAPLMFRRRLGRLPTLIAVLILTISTTAVAASRQMTGVGLSMLALLAALKALERYLQTTEPFAFALVGVALGVALLADFGALLGLVAMAVGFGFAVLTDEEGQLTGDTLKSVWRSLPWIRFVIGLIAALLAIGTLFFLAPRGLGAAADQIARIFSGIVSRPAGAPYLGLVILTYEPLLLIFGLLGAWIASQSPHPWLRFLAGWGVAAVLLSLVYPGALPFHSLWSAVPLAGLMAIALVELSRLDHDAPPWVIWAHAAGVAGLLAVIFARISHQLRAPMAGPLFPAASPGLPAFNIQLDLVWVVICLIGLVLLWLAVASFWEPAAAWQGLGIGLALPGLLLMLGQSGALAFTRFSSPFELLNQSPAQPGLVNLAATAEEVSEIASGNRRDASLTIQGAPDGVLAWELRRFTSVSFVERPSPDITSVLVITPAEGAAPFLGSSYVGQDFVIVESWDSSQLTPEEFVNWLFYRTADASTVKQERVILWVREDIYRLVPQQTKR